jgi:hypothetical protein
MLISAALRLNHLAMKAAPRFAESMSLVLMTHSISDSQQKFVKLPEAQTCTATHLSRLRLLCGHILATSTNRISSLTIGNTHLNLSSLIVCAIYIAISPF